MDAKDKSKLTGKERKLANLIPPKKGEPSRNPNGRPKKTQTILKETGLTKDDIRNAFTSVLAMTEDELKEVFDNPEAPVFFQILAKTMNKGKSKGFNEIRSMFEYIQPKAQTNLSIETRESLDDKSPEELLALREQLKKGLGE